jgi:hypothetical protein
MSLFDQIVKDSDGTKKELNLKLTERSIKRNFQSASDDLARQQDDAQIKYNKALTNIDGFDVNTIIAHKQVIKDADATKVLLQDTYKDLFDEVLV